MSEINAGADWETDPIVTRTAGEAPSFTMAKPDSVNAEDLAWPALPQVAMMLLHAPVSADPGAATEVLDRARAIARAIAPRAGPRLTRVGPVLLVGTSVQTGRIMASLTEEFTKRHGKPKFIRLRPLGIGALKSVRQNVRRVESDLAGALSTANIGEPFGLRDELLKVETFRRRIAKVKFRNAGIRAVIVGSQNNASVRALLSVVHHQHVSSYYIPHAPTADNAFYHDLPTNWALLRGASEVEFYRGLGATPLDHLAAVGNPGEPVSHATPPNSSSVVYAASAPEVIQGDIDVIYHAIRSPIKVSLHPRMRSHAYRRMFPSAWEIIDAPDTSTYLRRHGAKAVVQHGSGVGLEALSMGLDVIDLCHPQDRPNYPYIIEPYVQIVHDVSSLRKAMDKLSVRAGGRLERIDYAHSWCNESSIDVVRSIADLVEQSSTCDTAGGVLLDGWEWGCAAKGDFSYPD